jgi:hypothetical protein
MNNAGHGISAHSAAVVIGNSAVINGGFALVTSGAGYAQNNFDSNNGGNTNPQVQGGIEIGINICGGDTVCP